MNNSAFILVILVSLSEKYTVKSNKENGTKKRSRNFLSSDFF